MRLPFGLLSSVIVAVVLAYLYGLLMYFSPIVYLNVLICIGFGLALGFSAGFAAHLAHARSGRWRVGFAGLIALLAFLFHWCGYITIVLNDGQLGPIAYLNSLGMIFYPQDLFATVRLLNTLGVWEIAGIPNSGTFGWIIWLVEMIIILAVPIYVALNLRIQPYSELLGRFYKGYTLKEGFGGPVGSPTTFAQAVQERGFQPFTELEAPRPNLYYTFKLYFLEGENKHYLDINRVTISSTGSGKTSDRVVVNQLQINKSTALRIKGELMKQ